MNRYNSDADDHYVNVHLNTQMELPNNRDTVLHFFEQLKKGFPDLRNFGVRENGDLVLEGDKEQESHRWLAIEGRRLCSGHFNPESLDDSFRQHELVLELAPHLLTISLLDCEALDLMFGFDFHYEGNHDEVVAEAMGVGHGLEGLFELPRAQVVNFEPSLTLALNESYQLQCRLAVETRMNAYQARPREFGDDQIRVYFTVRQYWGRGPEMTFIESMRQQREVAEEIVQQTIIPRIVQPLAQRYCITVTVWHYRFTLVTSSDVVLIEIAHTRHFSSAIYRDIYAAAQLSGAQSNVGVSIHGSGAREGFTS